MTRPLLLRRMGFSRQKARPSHPRRMTPKRRSASKKGDSRHPEGDRRGASRQGAYSCGFRPEARASATEGRVMSPVVVGRGERAPSHASNRLPGGPTSSPPCARTPAMTTSRLVMPSAVSRRGHGPVDSHTSPIPWTRMRTPSPMCEAAPIHPRHDERSPGHRPRQRHHWPAVAALPSRTQPRVERVWLYLRERFLSLRVLDDTEAIIPRLWAKHGSTSSQNRIVCEPSAPINGSSREVNS